MPLRIFILPSSRGRNCRAMNFLRISDLEFGGQDEPPRSPGEIALGTEPLVDASEFRSFG
jgi:hypothetical protein